MHVWRDIKLTEQIGNNLTRTHILFIHHKASVFDTSNINWNSKLLAVRDPRANQNGSVHLIIGVRAIAQRQAEVANHHR